MPVVTVLSGGRGGAAPFVPITDPFFSSVVLLTHVDEVSPVDKSPSAHTLNVFGGSVQSTNKKFGARAYDAENSLSGQLQISPAGHSDSHFGSGEFTVECWVRWHNVPSNWEPVVSQWKTSGNQRNWMLYWESSQIRFRYSTNGTADANFGGSFTPTAGVFYHLAVDRDSSSDVRVYVDGVVKATLNIASALHPSTALPNIGVWDSGNAALDAVVDEIRITKGVRRYGGPFTPPSAPFPDS